jgi:hypothetical protein
MEDRGPELLGVVICFLVLSWVTVLARCYVRIVMIKAFAMDDWLLLLTLGFFTIYSGIVLCGVYWGCGKHMYDLSVQSRINAMHVRLPLFKHVFFTADRCKAWYYGEITYILATACLRLAVGAFLLRIAVRKVHRYIIFTCIAVNLIFNCYYLTFTIIQCSPISGFWLRFGTMKNVTCHADVAVASTFASSGISALIDWIFGVLPVSILWDLNINKRKKIALGMIMGMGAM